ncbi:zonadhesin-like [Saccoglossus kowalevskii]
MSCKCLTGETCCLLESTNSCESHTDCWGRCVHEADKCLPDETECVDEPCTCKFGDKCCLKGIDECALRFPGRALCRPHGCKVGVETPVTVVPGLCGPDCHCCKRSGSCSDCGGECRTACWPGEISQKHCDCTAAGHHCCVAQTRNGVGGGGIHGSPNYTSFDGSKFEYHGTCSYVLFRECTTDPQFVVITDHMNGQDTEDHYRSYVVNVRIILASTRIDITSNDVKVNDMSVTGILPMTTDEGVHINIGYEYKLVHVDFPEVFSLSWNGRDNIIATIDEDFHGYVCGLLGDADGDPRNDMMMILPDGLFELTNDDNEFGNNWEVPGSCNIRRAP